ncbi:MAG TPA: DNA translocase FtsK 4TM domain-containing protein [Candidatus Binatia bacterium]|nr:DNA translocase FtsK 4TM domain-containing protein [Candidatus Binatia bacterium]
MAPRTQTRPPSRTARLATRRPRGRRPAPQRSWSLLSPDQRRELSGVTLVGLGVLLAIVLAIPGGGSIAGPIHDSLLSWLGIGAWMIALGIAVTGARLLGRRQWTGGVLAAVGSVFVVVAVLGLFGLAIPGSAGTVGQRFSGALAARLGDAATAALMLLLICAGLVLAVELRVIPALGAIRRFVVDRAAQMQAGGPPQGARPKRRRDGAAVSLTGIPTPLAFSSGAAQAPAFPPLRPPVGEPEPPAAASQPEQAAPASTPAPGPAGEAFTREFEGTAEPPTLGPIPEAKVAHAGALGEEEAERTWVLPGVDLLDTVTGKRERLEKEVQATASLIEQTLASFQIQARVVGANTGPTVTQYEVQPAAGVPVRKIVGAQTDLSLAVAAPIRIQPFIPGKSAVGIEVPNKAAQLVSLKEVVSSAAFSDPRKRLAVALGADVSGHPVVGDLTRMPHLLVAGATGSGKSVCINSILAGLLLLATPAQLKLILIDPKRVELSTFADVPHLLVPVVVEPEAAVASLRWACKEMEERYKLFASHGARNIAAFNERAPGLGLTPLPYTVIVIDELADLMLVAAGEIEDLICRVAQLARAVGIHLIVATQRPSADIITGLIKANIPSRVAFAVSSGVDSRVIIDEMGAEKLLGRGDMLYLPIDEGKPRRLQGAFCSDRELESLIEHWKLQGRPEYQEEVFQVEANVSWARETGKRDPLFAKAAHTVAAEGRAAASLLQRKLNVGYTRAARLIDQLAEQRVVGPYEGSKSRQVLMDVLQVDELLAELGEE